MAHLFREGFDPQVLLAESGDQPDAVWIVDRRQARRELHLEPCTYEATEVADGDVVFETGQAYQVNRSFEGVMLLMPRAPRRKQYLEIHTVHPRGRCETSVCEVAWTRPFRLESGGECHMVGCHRVMGPCHYVQF